MFGVFCVKQEVMISCTSGKHVLTLSHYFSCLLLEVYTYDVFSFILGHAIAYMMPVSRTSKNKLLNKYAEKAQLQLCFLTLMSQIGML